MDIEEEGGNGSGAEVRGNERTPRDASVSELQSIQYDDKVHLYNSADGKQRWKCGWCNKSFHWNPTKALFNLARISKSDIAICSGKKLAILPCAHFLFFS
jgi:hypothetical protein